jgi:hypothetical protein
VETVIHEPKTLPEYWDAVNSGAKPFEVRTNDRDFKVGDILHLYRSVDADFYGAEFMELAVTYVLSGGKFGIEPGYVVMGLGEV